MRAVTSQFALIAFLVAAMLAPPAPAQESDASRPFAYWLGPQTNKRINRFDRVVGKPFDVTKDEKLQKYDISLRVVKGRDMKLPDSQNAVITYQDRKFRKKRRFQPQQETLYLVAQMQLKKKRLGWRFFTMNFRVKEGPLKGAIVHLRDGSGPKSILDPYIAVYALPDKYADAVGPLSFEGVSMFAK